MFILHASLWRKIDSMEPLWVAKDLISVVRRRDGKDAMNWQGLDPWLDFSLHPGRVTYGTGVHALGFPNTFSNSHRTLFRFHHVDWLHLTVLSI